MTVWNNILLFQAGKIRSELCNNNNSVRAYQNSSHWVTTDLRLHNHKHNNKKKIEYMCYKTLAVITFKTASKQCWQRLDSLTFTQQSV